VVAALGSRLVKKRVLVTGAAGMIGRKLVARLEADGAELTLHDVMPDVMTAGEKGLVSDLSAAGEAEKLVADRPELIFHLAAVVSGEAEADFDKGYRVNLDGTRRLFEAIRKEGSGVPGTYRPRVVFASSIAVFGAPFPEAIGDEFLSAPLTSYGTQKAIDELLLSDYSRRGFFDGIGIRLPTICVRPGKPNKAASGFFSGIIREPLAGQEAVLPVPESVRHWFASPRAAVGFLLHAAELDTEGLGARRNLTMPGISATVAEQIEALRRVAGNDAAKLIRREPDPAIQRIVSGWPQNFDAKRAAGLGFRADASFDDIIRIHLQDELQRSAPPARGRA
jgi:nucleoside-diphosphate-sugar epimerase